MFLVVQYCVPQSSEFFFGSVAVVNHVPLSLCKNCVATGDRFLPNKMCVLTSGKTTVRMISREF